MGYSTLIASEKINSNLKDFSNKKNKLNFSQNLFWDIDYENFNIDEYPDFVVERVLMYGSWSDWQLLLKYFSLEKIKKIVLNLKSIEPKTLNYLSIITNTPKESFRCFKLKQLMLTPWNC